LSERQKVGVIHATIMRRRPSVKKASGGAPILPFERLDEPAVSWRGDVQALEACLRSPTEVERRCRDIKLLLKDAAYRKLAEKQLTANLEMVRSWLCDEPEKFLKPANRLLLERVILQLKITVQDIPEDAWPGLHWIMRSYQKLASKTAPLRFSLLAIQVRD